MSGVCRQVAGVLPGNWLPYAKEYGFFGADIVVLVISSHGYADNPIFKVLSENTCLIKSPVSILFEGITRYLPRYQPRPDTGGAVSEADRFAEKVNEQEVLKGLNELRGFIELEKKLNETFGASTSGERRNRKRYFQLWKPTY